MARILNIEDSMVIRALLKAALEEHEVVAAEDGEEGLLKALTEDFDLILLDLGLPKMHGANVLDALKADDRTRDVPVIVCSAFGEERTAAVARERGAADVIRKPFEVEDLRARVAQQLPRG